jgi:hypothetical protein
LQGKTTIPNSKNESIERKFSYIRPAQEAIDHPEMLLSDNIEDTIKPFYTLFSLLRQGRGNQMYGGGFEDKLGNLRARILQEGAKTEDYSKEIDLITAKINEDKAKLGKLVSGIGAKKRIEQNSLLLIQLQENYNQSRGKLSDFARKLVKLGEDAEILLEK